MYMRRTSTRTCRHVELAYLPPPPRQRAELLFVRLKASDAAPEKAAEAAESARLAEELRLSEQAAADLALRCAAARARSSAASTASVSAQETPRSKRL